MKTIVKQLVSCIALLVFLITTSNTGYSSGVAFHGQVIGQALDNFMIKSEFRPHVEGFKIKHVMNDIVNGKEITNYSVEYIGKGLSFDIKVSQKTNKIIGINMAKPFSPNKQFMLDAFDDWLPAVTSRYGNPQKIETSDSEPFDKYGTIKQAYFYEKNKYTYKFSAASKNIGGNFIYLSIEAL